MTSSFIRNSLLQIAARNELRRGYLPLLSPAKEMRRLYQQKLQAEFEAFKAVHGDRVRHEVLQAQGVDMATAQPKFIVGMWIESIVDRRLQQMMREFRAL